MITFQAVFLKYKKFTIAAWAIFCAIYLAFFPLDALADNFGQQTVFNIDKTHDASGRSAIGATLVRVTDRLYFYADNAWWDALSVDDREKYGNLLQLLGDEFGAVIYPKLVAEFGSEARPGIDRDERLTILIHPMAKDAGGYINTADSYSRLQAWLSNEREMVYLNNRYLDTPLAKTYLAHEFFHIITFNQKDILRGVSEESWLDEMRADYTSTFLGYDTPYKGSNLEQRARDFMANPNNSLTEWLNEPADYGCAALFSRYLVDYYGIAILADSLKSEKTGIDSLNNALEKNRYDRDFTQIFSDWLVAILVNDCSYGSRYCYKNPSLAGLKVMPRINYLPTSSEASLSVTYSTTYFSGNWQKIVGGKGNLSLELSANSSPKFFVPYLLCFAAGECEIREIVLGGDGKGNLQLADFGRQYLSMTLMPYLGAKTAGFDGKEEVFKYSFKVAVGEPPEPDISPEDKRRQLLAAQIEALKKEIARIQTLLAEQAKPVAYSCRALTTNLSYGVAGSSQVRCLQEALRAQGAAIYPEGIVSGNFFGATRAAVIRFQEKYRAEILNPSGLIVGTGFVGALTRAKINQLIAGS